MSYAGVEIMHISKDIGMRCMETANFVTCEANDNAPEVFNPLSLSGYIPQCRHHFVIPFYSTIGLSYSFSSCRTTLLFLHL